MIGRLIRDLPELLVLLSVVGLVAVASAPKGVW